MARTRARLADVHPELVEQYAASNQEPFGQVWANPTPRLRWRCPVGHEFEEAATTRAKSAAKWKAGDWRTCPVCAGILAEFGCGHWKRYPTPVDVEAASSTICSTCRWEARDTHGETAVFEARELAATLPVHNLPVHLRPEVKAIRTRVLTTAWLDEHVHGRAGAIEAAVEALRTFDGSRLLPTADEARAAATAGGRIEVGEQAVWAAGLLYTMTGESIARPLNVPRSTMTALLHNLAPRASTRVITQHLRWWADDLGLKSAAEVTVPVPNDAGHWGRVDLIVTASDGRALVIEVDQTHKPRSLDKLRHARAAGAAALWVRWGNGPFTDPGDVPTVFVRPIAGRADR